ncbi:NYN domain-containing protein [Pseudofrankia sp. DC12]|uniref:NYN domain-containing protein n=1 Tax=Pseudofrankia sp. DC12 TaxID=683315 RepID=UPI0005F7BDF1|nr:NYN domain-containing protein [Pseudofrankia sp. DC12]
MSASGGGQQSALRVRSALFVDFENIHMGLQRLDAAAANRFAVNPQCWLSWLETLAYPALGATDFRRDLLIRYCYLNPVSSARYRAYFTRAGFHVVDCPPLTAAGKNSADIHIVIDVLDILGHPTRFDEVILLSADADYTPVMLRLRAHDRRTVIITSGPSARAFRAACDHVVGEDAFIDDALTLEPRVAPQPGSGAHLGIATAPGQAGGSAGVDLPPDDSDAAGAVAVADGDLPAEAAGNRPGRLAELTTRSLSDDPATADGAPPRRAASVTPGTPTVPGSAVAPGSVIGPGTSVAPATGPGMAVAPPSPSAPPSTQDSYLRQAIAEQVRELVTVSERPITLASAAQLVRAQLGPEATDGWAGTGSFKKLLALVDLPRIAVSAAPEYLYDPRRHTLPPGSQPGGAGQGDAAAPHAELIARISQVTDIPRLSSHEFRALFEELAAEVTAHGFNRTGTSRAVRDRCLKRGEHIGRGAVNFVLNGLLYAGRPPQPGDDADALACSFANNAVLLCQNARMELSRDEVIHLHAWITGNPALAVDVVVTAAPGLVSQTGA